MADNNAEGRDEVDRSAGIGHVTEDSFETWLAALRNRYRNEETHITIGGSRKPADTPSTGMCYFFGFLNKNFIN